MIALKPLLFVALLVGTSSAFALSEPKGSTLNGRIIPPSKLPSSSVLHMVGGGATIVEPPPPELKVRLEMDSVVHMISSSSSFVCLFFFKI
jgi:hypothetical protein